MKNLIFLSLLYIFIEASMPPVNKNLCGEFSNGTQIELGQMCDAKRRCSNAMNGTAVCRCDWVGKWTPRDGVDQSECVCDEDQKGLKLIEVDGECICPDNKVYSKDSHNLSISLQIVPLPNSLKFASSPLTSTDLSMQ